MSTLAILTRLLKRDIEFDDPDREVPDPSEEEIYQSWALLMVIVLLIGALCTSYFLQARKIRAVHETVISIFGGMIVGLIVRLAPGQNIQALVSFKYTYFFNILLPPIILNSGYELHQANFFRNLGTILTFAFFGTFLSAIVIGILVYLWTSIGIESIPISFVEALSVGATLSATDPVTVLSIFTTYKVDPKLYTIIFGESLLNDAVSIVMFETLQKFHGQDIYISSVFKGFGIFLVTFIVSLIIGISIGLGTALFLKHSHLRRTPQIESCLILLMAYSSYFFSNGCHMSGIVSLLFCGITLKHYAYYNMSRRTQLATKYLFQMLAQLAENFIFIYLGLSLFTETELIYKPMFILVTTVAVCCARYASVFPLSSLINVVLRQRTKTANPNAEGELSRPYQIMLFWAGLRGAVGVALAAGLEGEYAATLKATILVVVVLTVIVFGGTIGRMLEILGIRTGVPQEEEVSDDEFDVEEGGRLAPASSLPVAATSRRDTSGLGIPMQRGNSSGLPSPLNGLRRDESEDEDDGLDLPPSAASPKEGFLGSITHSLMQSSREDHAKWFLDFDDRVLKPVLLDHDSPHRGSKDSPRR